MVYADFGERLVTHFGSSGSLVLTASSKLNHIFTTNKEVKASIDLKPALTEEQLELRILRDFEERINQDIKNVFGKLLPKTLIPVVLERLSIPADKKVNTISKEQRKDIINCLKEFTLTINGLGEYNEAVITKGGINVKEINPSTLESKKCSGLYFVGEVLDLDALTGGYNLQVAWSTGYLAGISID